MFGLAGCSTSSGILPAGPNTFTITEHVSPLSGGIDEAERSAVGEANRYCAQQNRVFVPVIMGAVPSTMDVTVMNGYAVTFRCLLPSQVPP